MLPNFVCPGAARSATTALYYLLIQHPQIYLPSIKETRFFAIDYLEGLPWYESRYYSKVSDEIAIGDISPAYFIHDECPERIFSSLGPAVKFIFMLRNPVKRVLSHHKMLSRMQIEDLPLGEALQADSRQDRSLLHFRHKYGFRYLKESSYSERIQRYLDYFPMSNMKFVIFEEFTLNIESHLADISDFLGVRRDFKFNLDVYQNPNYSSKHTLLNRLFYRNALSKKLRTLIQLNTNWHTQVFLKNLKNTLLSARRGTDQPAPESNGDQEARLKEYFRDEILRLEKLLNRDLSIWKVSP